jgi:hypothetical protein
MWFRRGVLGALGLAAVVGATASLRLLAQTPAPDPVARLLADLEAALASGDAARLTPLESPTLGADVIDGLAGSVVHGPASTVVLRERGRKKADDGADVLVDVFLARGDRARVVTWRIKARQNAGRWVIAGADEQGAIDDLLRLKLDTSEEFTVHNLDLHPTDLSLTMATGQAFVAKTEDGVTALVLHGKAQIRFAPPDRAEQGQLQAFGKHPDLSVDASEVFVRLSPSDFAAHIAEGTLTPRGVSADILADARAVFDEFAPQTYGIDLRDLGQTGWSFEPRSGNVVVEFKTDKFGWLTYTRSPGEFEDVSLFKRVGSKLISSYASAERIATRGRFYDEAANATFRIEHYDLDADFDPLRRAVHGRAILHVRTLADAVSSLTLRLNDDLSVVSVTAPGAERLLAVRLTGQQRILVRLPGALPRDARVILEIEYAGHLTPGAFDREAMTADQITQDFPSTTDYRPDPERAWIYSGRSAWYPEPETFAPATATLRVHVPAEFDVVASGAMSRSSVDAPTSAGPGQRTVEFTADRPLRYLACAISHFAPVATAQAIVPGVAPAAIGALRPQVPGPASVDVSVVATPKAANQSRALATRASDIVHYYSALIGEMPYSALTVASLDDNIPGGHSPAYLTLLRSRLPSSPFNWRLDPVAFTNVSSFLLAHEVAHQWWGQAVGWKNYHEQWLSEGLAQYFAVLYAGSVQGPTAAHDLLAAMRSSVFDQSSAGPIYLGNRLGRLTDDPSTYRVILYNKSAVVLDMLRRLIGDKAFFDGLKTFYGDHRFGSAGTDDLTKALQAGTDYPVARFFDTWVMNPGIPEASVRVDLAPGGRAATVRVEPVNFPADYPLTVTIQYLDGSSEDVTIPVVGGSATRDLSLKGPARRVAPKDDISLVRVR